MRAQRKAPRKSLGLSASLVFIATLVSRLSGFAREIVMAAFFGTSMFTDAWLMASALPNLLFSTLNGAISVTVVPLMTAADAEHSPRSIARFLNEVFTVVFLAALGLTLLGEIFAPVIIHIMAPGFDHHPEELRLTINMTRIMIPTIFFWGVAGLAAGILQAREEYFTPAVSPVAINLVRVITIVVLGHYLFGIQGVALGFSLAVISQLLVLLPRLRAMGIHLHFRWHFSHPLLKQMARMAGPFFLTSSVGSIGILVDRILASELGVGSIAALNYSYVLVQIPVGLLVSSLAMPIYTRLSQHNSYREMETFRELAMQGFRLVLAIIVPITLWFIVLRVPILRLLYQHGVFNGRSTDLTAGTLLYFSVGLPGFGLSYYLQRLFFASRDTKSPARFSIITILTNIVGDLILVHFMQADGLALATGLASWVNATLLALKALKPRSQRNLAFTRTFVTLVVSGALTLFMTLALRHAFHLLTLSGIIPLFFALAFTAIVSGILYFACLSYFRYPEVGVLLSRLTRGRYLPRR
ncbi:MAG: murein biosynthesis integral membrane protein MurJ [Firmicutes bacterium]|nr:murein biosynthesis integral membrane protein MurJ [Bacillota bacterium]